MASKEDWETDIIGYSEYNFYTNAKDNQGHSTAVHTKYPDYLLSAVSRIVQSGKIPQYKTRGDVFRDSLVHRLYWINKHEDNIPGLSELVQVAISKEMAINRARVANELNDWVKEVKNTCETLYSLADYSELKEAIEEQKERAESVRDPYRKRVLEILDEYERKLPKGESA